MEYYIWPPLILACSALAWQDWKTRQVNVVLSLITAGLLIAGMSHFLQAGLIFFTLVIYKYIRKNTIQPIDIILFSLGAGHFPQVFLTLYTLSTAALLLIFFKITKDEKIPFITAWAMGFFVTVFLHYVS